MYIQHDGWYYPMYCKDHGTADLYYRQAKRALTAELNGDFVSFHSLGPISSLCGVGRAAKHSCSCSGPGPRISGRISVCSCLPCLCPATHTAQHRALHYSAPAERERYASCVEQRTTRHGLLLPACHRERLNVLPLLLPRPVSSRSAPAVSSYLHYQVA